MRSFGKFQFRVILMLVGCSLNLVMPVMVLAQGANPQPNQPNNPQIPTSGITLDMDGTPVSSSSLDSTYSNTANSVSNQSSNNVTVRSGGLEIIAGILTLTMVVNLLLLWRHSLVHKKTLHTKETKIRQQ